jgi:hypothetical protein
LRPSPLAQTDDVVRTRALHAPGDAPLRLIPLPVEPLVMLVGSLGLGSAICDRFGGRWARQKTEVGPPPPTTSVCCMGMLTELRRHLNVSLVWQAWATRTR